MIDFWKRIALSHKYPSIMIIVGALLTLPHSTCEVEHAFSVISLNKTKLNTSTLDANREFEVI